MMRNHVDVHGSELVHRTHQLHFLVGSQVAQIEDSQFSKGEKHAQRPPIFRLIRRILWRGIAAGVFAASSTEGLFNQRAIRTNDFCIHAL